MMLGAICMAVYRPDPALLETQLRSIQAQSLKDWTCLVGIDGRDPTTFELLIRTVGNDERFKPIEFEDNVGFYLNFERVIAMSEGAPWVALADQDDYWYPDKLASLVDRLDGERVFAVSAQARIVDSSGRELSTTHRKPVGLAAAIIDNQLTGSLAVISGQVITASLPFPPPTDAAYHDHWLAVIARTLGSIEFATVPLQDYVQHESNVLGEHGQRSLSDRLLNNLRRRVGPRYLAKQRWNWRVTMATWAMHRLDVSSKVLETFSYGHFTPRLLREICVAVVKREAPAGRSLALLIGAIFWRQTYRGGV